MVFITPEAAGISSMNILKMLRSLEDNGLNMHDCLIAKGEKICFEAYWAPFHKDYAHRLYSVTKSFVSIAIGILVDDGLIDINKRILEYFPEYDQITKSEHVRAQTVKDMLMMATAKIGEASENWFISRSDDRLRYYFENTPITSKIPGTMFYYDSNGSFVLCALVEKITGMSFLEFLRKRIFDRIGMSDNIKCLTCPGGHSWGDSALIMPARDLMKFAMLIMNKGVYKGEQLISSEYLNEATKKQIDNSVNQTSVFNAFGYGYQIWRTYDDSYSFNGMGSQYVIFVPDKELIFVCNSDNQGIEHYGKTIFDSFFENVARNAEDHEIESDEKEIQELDAYVKSLKLSVAKGSKTSALAEKINGVEFEILENKMGITSLSVHFENEGGILKYTNAQGAKEIEFGMCENAFGLFPEDGYSSYVGGVSSPGHKYKCAASAAWVSDDQLYIKVQIIDEYFGNLHIALVFCEAGDIQIRMRKNAEAFLNEYEGYAYGRGKRNV